MHTRDCVYQMKSAHIRTEVVTDGDSLLEFVFVIEDMREREREREMYDVLFAFGFTLRNTVKPP